MPTLTEVLELEPAEVPSNVLEALPADGAAPQADTGMASVPESMPVPVPVPEPEPAPLPVAPMDTQALVHEVLAELQPRIDMLLDSRLREALAPALARAADGLIRDARGELGSALHELVDDAVKRALLRRGGRR